MWSRRPSPRRWGPRPVPVGRWVSRRLGRHWRSDGWTKASGEAAAKKVTEEAKEAAEKAVDQAQKAISQKAEEADEAVAKVRPAPTRRTSSSNSCTPFSRTSSVGRAEAPRSHFDLLSCSSAIRRCRDWPLW
ncbi:unnamed protein product [Durusdinium trenchii]|uniref:Uncharacterized protein n=1 Tax=Durusdinium trenchii TaxID=1381693 RepID=A0ABP0N0X5_9DINO